MHEYRRFIQQQLDERGWKRPDLVRASGLTRQLVWSILSDERDHLGQMPDDNTLEGLSKGFGLPVEVFRTAAARSLAGYTDDGSALTIRLQDVPTDALLNEVRRRIDTNEERRQDHTVTPIRRRPSPEPARSAARDVGTESEGRRRRREQDEAAEHPDE